MFIQKIVHFLRGIWVCFFYWRVEPANSVRLADCDVVLAQDFGLRKNDPGKSNRILAEVIRHLQYQYPLPPPLVQQATRDALPPDYLLSGVAEQHGVAGKYLDTREVFRQHAKVCHRKGWRRVIVVAHPDHLWRVMEVVRAFDLEPVAMELSGFEHAFEPIAADTDNVPYDPLSLQWWTRGRKRFLVREIPTRIYYLLRGWIDQI